MRNQNRLKIFQKQTRCTSLFLVLREVRSVRPLNFTWRPQLFIGDPQLFIGDTQIFIVEPYSGDPSRRPQIFVRDPQIFIEDPRFSLETPHTFIENPPIFIWEN